MTSPTPQELLAAWEQGVGASPTRRVLELLRLAEPGMPVEGLPALTVGQADARLRRLRRLLFGTRLELVGACPACKVAVEVGLDLDRMEESWPGGREPEHAGLVPPCRPATLADLEAVEGEDAAEATALLARRCSVATAAFAADAPLRPEELESVSAALARLDPVAALDLVLSCPACGTEMVAPLDLGAVLWAELSAWAGRMLRDVADLARAFGWSEPEVLGLSPTRRRLYLELAEP